MKLIFPICFAVIVIYCFVAPKYQAAQDSVSRTVAAAVGR
jgi:hypothetical protein